MGDVYVDARSLSALDTSTWGSRKLIRPGVLTTQGGSGFGPDYKRWVSLLDVRVPTDLPSLASKSFVLYATAYPVFDSNSGLASTEGAQQGVIGRLETGSGGVTRSETFTIPASGKVQQIAADSVRFSVKYSDPLTPDSDPTPDTEYGMLGWELNAAVSISGTYGRKTVTTPPPFPPSSLVPSFVIPIPPFVTTLRFLSPTPTVFDLGWEDRFGEDVLSPLSATSTPVRINASRWADGRAIPPAASQMRLYNYLPANPTEAPMFEWGREA